MKKILAIILALTCVFAMFSCGKEGIEDQVESIERMYSVSAPTKIVATTSSTFGNIVLDGTYTYVTGKIDGKIATVEQSVYEELASVEDGKGEIITGAVKTVSSTKEFHEDLGIRESYNGAFKNWTDGYNFAPVAGDIAIDLAFENLKDVKYENNTLSFTVTSDKTAAVLGEDYAQDADIAVAIVNDGSVVTSITMSYTLEAEGDYPETAVVISISYEYDIQEVTLVK